MATEIDKFILQSAYFIERLEHNLYGKKINDNEFKPGLLHFKPQMCENYETIKEYAKSQIKNIYISDKIDSTLREWVITNDDYYNLFKIYKVNYSTSTSDLVHAFDSINKGANNLNKKKRRILFAGRTAESRMMVATIVGDYKACGELNDSFLRLYENYSIFKDQSKSMLKGKIMRKGDITFKQFNQIVKLERRGKELADEYNNFKNSGCGIKILYDTVGALVNNHILPNNKKIQQNIKHSKFDSDAMYRAFSIKDVVGVPAEDL